MKKRTDKIPLSPSTEKPVHPSIRAIFVIIQIAFVLAIFVLWFSSRALRESKNLWILFLCAFPSNFISGIFPYDPSIIFFGKFYPAIAVTLVGVASTMLVEGINWYVLNFISASRLVVKVRENRFIQKLVRLFYKSPFMTLMVVGFLPFPFYPFRFLVILSQYSILKYLLSVLLSKFPRMYLLAQLGHFLNIPNYVFFIFFIAIIVCTYITFLIHSLKNRHSKSLIAPGLCPGADNSGGLRSPRKPT